MREKPKEYSSDSIVVRFEPRRCIHAAECVHGLPEVFEAGRRPWVDPGRGGADEIAAVVERCPTGALTYERLDGGRDEAAAEANTARPAPDGPLLLRGRIRIELPDGEIAELKRVALCRCGATSNRPFCDGSHSEAGFSDPGELGTAASAEADSPPGVPLEVACAPNGPLVVKGPVGVSSGDGAKRQDGVKAAFCRCGASGNKPYCDGSHAAVGFRTEP